MVHVGWDDDTIIGNYCAIGHRAVVHGCTIEPGCLIGIGATIMERCVIGRGSIVAGHSFLPADTIVPPHSPVIGTPGRVGHRIDNLHDNIVRVLLYRENGKAYAAGVYRAWETCDMVELEEEAHTILIRERSGWEKEVKQASTISGESIARGIHSQLAARAPGPD